MDIWRRSASLVLHLESFCHVRFPDSEGHLKCCIWPKSCLMPVSCQRPLPDSCSCLPPFLRCPLLLDTPGYEFQDECTH